MMLFEYKCAPSDVVVGGSSNAPTTLTFTVTNDTARDQHCTAISITLPPQLRGRAITPVADPPNTWSFIASGSRVFTAQPTSADTGLGAGQEIRLILSGIAPPSTPGRVLIQVQELTDDDRRCTLEIDLVQAA